MGADRSQSVIATHGLIEKLKAQYDFVTIPQMMAVHEEAPVPRE
jgi:hypothetical protein